MPKLLAASSSPAVQPLTASRPWCLSTKAHRRVLKLAVVSGMRLAAVLIAFAQGACRDEPATAPLQSINLPRTASGSRMEMKALPPVSQSLPAAPTTSVFLGNYPHPEMVLAELRILGTITLASHPNATYTRYSGPIDAGGIPIYGVYQQCSLTAKIACRGPGCKVEGTVGTDSEWVDTALVGGNVYAVRGPPVPSANPACDSVGSPCRIYSGSQTAELTPLPAEFATVMPGGQFRPRNSTIYWNSTVTPNGAKGIPMPLRIVSRTWIKADPADSTGAPTSPSCSLIQVACAAYFVQSGTLVETARANGVIHTDSLTVQCATGDPLLDQIVLRNGAVDAINSTNAFDPDPDERIEQVFALVVDSRIPSPHLNVVHIRTISADRCNSSWKYLLPSDNLGRVLAYFHTHPTAVGESYSCPNKPGAVAGAGLSIDDDIARNVVNSRISTDSDFQQAGWQPVPWYAIDKHNVYRLPPGAPLSASTTPSNTFAATGRCKWLRS